MPQRLRQWSRGSRQTDRQTETAIKPLDQSREETDETVWEQYDAAIGLIDPKPNRIKERRGTARSSQRSPPTFCCHCPLGGV